MLAVYTGYIETREKCERVALNFGTAQVYSRACFQAIN